MAEPSTRPSPELDIIELTKLLVRQWPIVLLVWLTVLALATVRGVWMTPEVHRYVSIYQVAERDGLTPLRPVEDTLARIQRIYVRDAREATGVALGASASQPRHTLLVVLESVAPPDQAEDAATLHEAILQRVIDDDEARLARRQAALSSGWHLSLTQDTHGVSGPEEAQAGEVLQLAQRSAPPRSHSPMIWVLLGTVLGLILGVLAGCLTAFIGSVRRSLAAERAARR